MILKGGRLATFEGAWPPSRVKDFIIDPKCTQKDPCNLSKIVCKPSSTKRDTVNFTVVHIHSTVLGKKRPQ